MIFRACHVYSMPCQPAARNTRQRIVVLGDPRPPDRCRVLAVEDQSESGAPAAKRGRTTLTLIFARRQQCPVRGGRPRRCRRESPRCVPRVAGLAGAGPRRCGQLPTPVRCAKGSGPSCPATNGETLRCPGRVRRGTPPFVRRIGELQPHAVAVGECRSGTQD